MQVFRRIVWKECRATWVLWVGAGVATVALFVLLRLVTRDAHDVMPAMRSLALWIPPLVAMGALSAWFAGEREERTADWLLALSAPSAPVLLARIGLAWLGGLVLQGVLIGTAATLGATWGSAGNFYSGGIGWDHNWWAAMLYLSVASVAWSLLSSLLCRKPATAIVAAAMSLLVVETLLAPDRRDVGFTPFWSNNTPPLTWLRVLVTVAVLAVDVWLGDRWLRGQRVELSRLWRWALTDWSLRGWRQRSELTMPWQRAMRRLLWLETRRCSRMAGWFAASLVGVAFSVWWFPDDGANNAMLWSTLVALGCGLASFSGEFTAPAISFWRHRSVASTAVWCVKQAVWLPWVTVWIAAVVGLTWAVEAGLGLSDRQNSLAVIWDEFHNNRLTFAMVAGLAVGVWFTWYAMGQLAMLATRRAVPAIFLAMFGAGLLTAAHLILTFLHLPQLLAIAPIVVWLFAFSTWLWQRRAAERSDWRGIAWMGGWWVVPPLAIWMVALTYWVESVPDLRPVYAADVARLQTPLTPAELRTREDLLQAGARVTVEVPQPASQKTSLRGQLSRHLTLGDADATTTPVPLETLLAPNREVLVLARELSQRDVPAIALPREDADYATTSPLHRVVLSVGELSALLCLSALELTRQQQFDAALDDYLAAMRLQHLQARRAVLHRWVFATSYLEINRGLVDWANQPQQTSARITAALGKLQALAEQAPPLEDALLATYIVETEQSGLDRGWFPLDYLGAVTRDRRLRSCTLDNRLRWARNVTEGHWSARQHGWPEGIVTPAWRVTDPHNRRRDIPIGLEDWSTRYLWYGQTQFRGTQLVMAALAYRLDRGQNPTDLDDLASYFPQGLPLDPYSGGYFQYKPRGFPFFAKEERSELQKLADVPVIWSVGSNADAVKPPKPRDEGYASTQSWVASVAFVIPPKPEPAATADVPHWRRLEQLANQRLRQSLVVEGGE